MFPVEHTVIYTFFAITSVQNTCFCSVFNALASKNPAKSCYVQCFFHFWPFFHCRKATKMTQNSISIPSCAQTPKNPWKMSKTPPYSGLGAKPFLPPPAKADIATAILTNVIEHLVLLLPPNKHAFTAKAVWADCFSVRESVPRETRDSSLSARLKSENEKKMQLSKSWKLKLHKRTCMVYFYFFGGCTVLEQSRKECESKTWRHIHMSKLSQFGALSGVRFETVQELQKERVRQQELIQKQKVPRDLADYLWNFGLIWSKPYGTVVSLKEYFKVIPFRITIPVAHVTDVEFARMCILLFHIHWTFVTVAMPSTGRIEAAGRAERAAAGLCWSCGRGACDAVSKALCSPIQDWTVTVWYFSHVCGFVVKPSCLKCCMKATITLDSSAVRQSEM